VKLSLVDLLRYLPEVKKPAQKKLSFKQKLKWSLIILVSFFVLSSIPLYGLGQNSLAQFEHLSIILGAKFGSILSLGIGPIVTASIVLQLLVGSGLLKIDQTSHEGRTLFEGLQKVFSIFFIIFEAVIYVFLGGFSPSPSLAPGAFFNMELILTAQLILGGFLILFMAEVIDKYGFGSGVSMFIAAGVSGQIFIRAFSPLTSSGVLAFGSGQAPVGAVLVFLNSLIKGNPQSAFIAFSGIAATILVFLFSVYAQAMKVEIPLTFGRVRGYGMRWPLNFLYTSNIPVILVAALMANFQLWGRLFGANQHSLFMRLFQIPRLVQNLLMGSFTFFDITHALVYTLIMIVGAVIFSVFWVQTSGQDAGSVAKQIMSSGLQIPGFRRDQRVLETLLKRYIGPLSVMGGIAIGILAASADLLGALSRGTGILLAVMIVYRLYEEISKQHMMDMYPSLRKMIAGE